MAFNIDGQSRDKKYGRWVQDSVAIAIQLIEIMKEMSNLVLCVESYDRARCESEVSIIAVTEATFFKAQPLTRTICEYYGGTPAQLKANYGDARLMKEIERYIGGKKDETGLDRVDRLDFWLCILSSFWSLADIVVRYEHTDRVFTVSGFRFDKVIRISSSFATKTHLVLSSLFEIFLIFFLMSKCSEQQQQRSGDVASERVQRWNGKEEVWGISHRHWGDQTERGKDEIELRNKMKFQVLLHRYLAFYRYLYWFLFDCRSGGCTGSSDEHHPLSIMQNRAFAFEIGGFLLQTRVQNRGYSPTSDLILLTDREESTLDTILWMLFTSFRITRFRRRNRRDRR